MILEIAPEVTRIIPSRNDQSLRNKKQTIYNNQFFKLLNGLIIGIWNLEFICLTAVKRTAGRFIVSCIFKKITKMAMTKNKKAANQLIFIPKAIP